MNSLNTFIMAFGFWASGSTFGTAMMLRAFGRPYLTGIWLSFMCIIPPILMLVLDAQQ